MAEVVLDFGTLASFTTVMKAANLWDTTNNVPVTSKTFANGSSLFLNVIGITFTNTGTPTAPVWTANPGYWTRLRWNADPGQTWGGKTLAQIQSALTTAGVTIYPLVKYLANGQVDTTYTCPAWAAIL